MKFSRYTLFITAALLPAVAVAHAAPVAIDDEYKVVAQSTVTSDAVQILALNDQGVDNRTSGGGGNGPGVSDGGGTVGGAGGGGTGTGSPDGNAGVPVPPAN